MKFILGNLQTSLLLILMQFCTINILFSQAPGCPGVTVSDDVVINCVSSNTVNLSANYLEIGETTSYDVSPISYAPPFSYSGLENPISVGTDDVWSPIVNLPFNFCFYGNMYTQCIISSNGAISFDTNSNTPGGYSQWYFSNTVPSTNLFLNSIFGVYHDMDPSLGGEVAYELLGSAPCRKLVVSYHDVPLYSCRTSKSTFQVVLYETTNIIEVYIEEKSVCYWWNSGNSVVGIQNENASLGLSANNRNTSNWEVESSNPEAWRFTPSGSLITSVKWFDAVTDGNEVGTSNNITVTPLLTTTYRAEVEYLMCDGSSTIETDTVVVHIDDCPSTIDFDGIDDFILVESVLSDLNAFSKMAWVKLDDSSTGNSVIMGESNSLLSVNNDRTITASIVTDLETFNVSTAQTINSNEWTHLSSTFDGAYLKIYINGEEKATTAVTSSSLSLSTSDFHIGKNPMSNIDYIKADIQEVKVYNIALTQSQLQEQIYQTIINNEGNVKGEVTGKNINDLSWNSLKLYLKLVVGSTGTTSDDSSLSNTALLYHMTSAQDTTAPLPYIADASGNWQEETTWKYGDVWDIENTSNKDWAIVKITNNSKVITNTSRSHLGLLIDSGSELEVQNNQLLKNSNYLKIDGHIDLVGESQLIQTASSELAVSSLGYVEKDQQGKSSMYRYNYWCSPVSIINISNNNLEYKIADILKDGTNPDNPLNINFNSTSYDGASTSPITIADYWIFTFNNMPDNYNNWNQIRSNGVIKVGEGFTMKGTGASSLSQNYVFSGKPNNGLIEHELGASNLHLVGNPYLSALDANAFILDNIGANSSIDGTLYFWEHWGGDSHVLSAYEGGYASYNLLGGVMAVSDPMVSSNGSGTIQPQQYIPVSQGFFVKGDIDGGTIKFNNSQRVFKKESDGNSVFVRSVANQNNIESVSLSTVEKIYFNFTTPEGSIRELLLGIKDGLTTNIEKGYDGLRIEETNTDCAWKIADKKYVIQGIGALHNELELPLSINVGASGVSKFSISDFSNVTSGLHVYLRDKELNIDSELVNDYNVELNLTIGNYDDRYYVVFKQNILEVEEHIITNDELLIYFNKLSSSIKISSTNKFSANNFKLYNTIGQVVYQYDKAYEEINIIDIPVAIAKGVYVISFVQNEKQISKKILIQ